MVKAEKVEDRKSNMITQNNTKTLFFKWNQMKSLRFQTWWGVVWLRDVIHARPLFGAHGKLYIDNI